MLDPIQWMTPEEFQRYYTPDSFAAAEKPKDFWQPGALDTSQDEAWARSLGFGGPLRTTYDHITEGGGGDTLASASPEFQQFLADRGLTQKMTWLPGVNQLGYQYFDPEGKAVGMFKRHTLDPDAEFGMAAKIAMAIMTGGAAAAGLGSMGGAIGGSMGLSGGLGAAVGNGLLSAGMGAVTNGSDGFVNGLASGARGALGSYLGGAAGNSLMPGEGGYSIEPGSFDTGSGASMFDWGDLTSGLDTGGSLGSYDFGGGSGGGDFNMGGDLGQIGQTGWLGNYDLGQGGGALGDYNLYDGVDGGADGGTTNQTGGGIDWTKLLQNKNLINLLGGLGGAALQQYGLNRTNGQIQNGINASNALLKYMYDTTRADNMPALQARNAGLTGYQGLLTNPSSITSDPGYKFGMDQGTKAIGSQAAARGGYYSGATLKALDKFGQDYAGTKFDSALNRYGNLAGLGQVGTSQIGQAGMNYGNNTSQNALMGGMARGANTMAGVNNWADTLNKLISYGNQNVWGG